MNCELLRGVLFVAVVGACLTGAPVISVQPSTVNLSSGDFTVSVVATGFTDLYAFQFDLGFNPSVVVADSVTEGSFLESEGSTVFVPGTLDNVGGAVSNTADTLLTAISGVSGSGTLATFKFTVVGPGSTTLDIFNDILLDSSLSEIAASLTNGSVTSSAIPEPASLGLFAAGLSLTFAKRFLKSGRQD